MFKARIQNMLKMLDDYNADVIVITMTDNLFYLTGLTDNWNQPSLSHLLLGRDRSLMVTVEMEEEKVRSETDYTPLTLPKEKPMDDEIMKILKDYYTPKTVLFDHLEYNLYQRFEGEFGDVKQIAARILDIRSIKTDEEVETMRKAAQITTDTLGRIEEFIHPGITESDLAAEIEYYARRRGSEGNCFPTIVASAERSSLAHGVASDKVIPDDTVIVIDFGSRYRGYCSDFTRFYFLGKPPRRYFTLSKAVTEAFQRSVVKIRSDIDAREAYGEAVKVFNCYGFERYFFHPLGHGVGINVHEPPRLSWKEQILREGNVVTVEPGLYIQGFGGIRLEDVFLVRSDGVEALAELKHEFFIP